MVRGIRTRARWWSRVLAVFVVVPACRLDNLAFRQPSNFAVVQPEDRALVTLPVQLRWTSGPAAESSAQHFGVFVDRAPQPPGRSLGHFKMAEPSCFPSGGGLREDCLSAEGIYLTSSTSLILHSVPRRLGGPKGLEDHHDVTIVRLDADTRRRGETAARVQFRVDRGKR